MKRKIIVLSIALSMLAINGFADEEMTLLKEQLQALSARVSQLETQVEAGNGAAQRIVQLEAQLKSEQINSTRIAELEKKVEQGTLTPSILVSRIDQLEKRPAVPQWIMDTEFHGDFRYRYENTEMDGANKKDRQRVRARIGAYGSVNEDVDYGIRFATGGDSATSANETQGDGFLKDDAYFDLYYIDIHPAQFKGAHLLLGKMKKPWLKGSGLIWDSDTNPEGIAVKYSKKFEKGKLIASAGSFVVADNKGDDTQLWSAQVAGETKVDNAKVVAGISLYRAENPDESGLPAGYNHADSDFNLIEGFGSVGTKVGKLPVKLHGQYVVNTEAEVDDDSAYLLGVVLGKAKKTGSWQLGYNWRDTGRDAVADAFNDSDFAGGGTGSYGHQVKAKYQVSKNVQAVGSYFNTVNGDGKDEDMLQLDLVVKF